jgi:hypothetical protein
MLYPIKEVMEGMQGAQRDHSAEERGGYILTVDRVMAKLFHENTAEELGIIKDTFWAKWQKSQGKTGPFYTVVVPTFGTRIICEWVHHICGISSTVFHSWTTWAK